MAFILVDPKAKVSKLMEQREKLPIQTTALPKSIEIYGIIIVGRYDRVFAVGDGRNQVSASTADFLNKCLENPDLLGPGLFQSNVPRMAAFLRIQKGARILVIDDKDAVHVLNLTPSPENRFGWEFSIETKTRPFIIADSFLMDFDEALFHLQAEFERTCASISAAYDVENSSEGYERLITLSIYK